MGSYYCGPVIGSVLCGLYSGLLMAAGMVLMPLWRFIVGSDNT
jgi:hypothetical protein